MLGLWLDDALHRQLESVADRTGCSKSDVAREAVRDYLARHDVDTEFQRQVALLGDRDSAEDRAWREAGFRDWLRALDEEDGGYNWGGRSAGVRRCKSREALPARRVRGSLSRPTSHFLLSRS